MMTYSKFVSKIEIEPGIFEIKNNIYDKGSCQCFKDCDCYKNKGKFLFENIRYSCGIITEFGKERNYFTLEGCKSSLKAYKLKLIK